jgi:iron complex outermembrane receptor protein
LSSALAWKIKSESFLENVYAISDLKLRLGYGITGQQNLGSGDYPYLARYTFSTNDNTAQYQLGNSFFTTLRPEGYDESLKWEETTTYNIGLDFGFANNRITGAVDVYKRITNDLLNKIPVPAGSNLTNELLTNVGNLENRGFEFSLIGKAISTPKTTLEIGYNLSYNQNEITKLTMTDDPDYLGVFVGDISGGVGSKIQIHSVGYPSFSYFVYEQVYDANNKPIEGLYVDRSKDGVINEDDKYRYKKPAPDILMGISASLTHKNWDIGFSGRVSLENYVYNNVNSTNGTYLDLYNPGLNYLSNVLSSANEIEFSSAQYFSDYYVENASFFRMDNISLGYRFNNVLNNALDIRIGAVVQNAFVITEYKGLDPEVDGGIDNNFYPRARTFLMGITVDF